MGQSAHREDQALYAALIGGLLRFFLEYGSYLVEVVTFQPNIN